MIFLDVSIIMIMIFYYLTVVIFGVAGVGIAFLADRIGGTVVEVY